MLNKKRLLPKQIEMMLSADRKVVVKLFKTEKNCEVVISMMDVVTGADSVLLVHHSDVCAKSDSDDLDIYINNKLKSMLKLASTKLSELVCSEVDADVKARMSKVVFTADYRKGQTLTLSYGIKTKYELTILDDTILVMKGKKLCYMLEFDKEKASCKSYVRRADTAEFYIDTNDVLDLNDSEYKVIYRFAIDTNDVIECDDCICHRLRAVVDFSDVKAGQLSGYVHLFYADLPNSLVKTCWLDYNAMLLQGATLRADARLKGEVILVGEKSLLSDNIILDGNYIVNLGQYLSAKTPTICKSKDELLALVNGSMKLF